MPTQWQDAITLKVFISKAGDFVALGNRQEYPFTPGGSGIPAGWTMYNTAGTSPSDVNFTTQGGRFSISNALAASNGGKFYGAYRDFPVTPGKYYIFQLQARQMDDKTTTKRNIRYEWSTGVGYGAYGTAQTDWEQVSIPTGAAPAGATFLRIIVQAVYYTPAGQQPEINWGAQFQNVSIIEQDATYPEPEWDEITCEVQNLNLRYGRDRFVSRYDVGQMSLGVVNNSGAFTYDPTKTLRPGRFIKVEAQELPYTNIYDQFYGIIDSLTDSFTLDGRAMTVIQAVDISSLLAGQQVPTASWDTSTFYSGSRFIALLNAVAWHPTMRVYMAGQFIQQAILANGRSVRDELGLIADSEGGYFFADRSGKLTYMDRTWNTLNIRQVNAELMAQPVELVTPMEPTVKFAFNGVIGNYMTTPYFAALNVAGDLDIQMRVSLNNWGAARYETFCARYEGSTFSWIFRKHNTGGLLNFFVTGLGSSRISTERPPLADGERGWVRVTREAFTGTVRFWWARDTPSNSSPAVWTQLGADVTSTPGALASTTAGVVIGARSSGQDPLDGFMWVCYLRNSLTGTSAANGVLYISNTSAKNKQGQTSFTVATPTGQVVNVLQIDPFWVIAPDPTPGTPALPVVDDIPNVSGTNTPIICLRELQTTWSRDRVVNEVSLANQGGSSITTIDAASQQKYGPRTYQRMDLLNVNDHPEYLTTRTTDIMDGYTDAIVRVNSVQFRPQPDQLVYWFTLRVWLNWLVRVRYTHPSEGWGFSVVSHVQGIEHSFTQTDWVVTLLLDNPEAFNYWNEATNSGWDVSEWDTDLWDQERADSAFWNSGQRWSEGHRWG